MFLTGNRSTETGPPSIRIYLISMNLGLLLIFALISLLFWQHIGEFHQLKQSEGIVALHKAMQSRSTSLVRSMTLSANQAIAGYDFSFLNTLIQQVALDDGDIRYCMVTNQKGVVVAHSDPAMVGVTSTGEIDKQALGLGKAMFETSPDTSMPFRILELTPESGQAHPIMEVVTPVTSGRVFWGVMRCGFSLEHLQAHIEEQKQQWASQLARSRGFYLSVVALFLVFGFLIALLVTRRLLGAIEQLGTGVKQVANGGLNYRLGLDGLICSEFTEFAVSFNHMTAYLEASRRQLDENNRLLEQKVAERTAELERSNEELEAFNYSVSHDLRAPLRSINGFGQALEEEYREQLDETGLDYIRRVQLSASRMGMLIDDMLRLSRIGRQEMKRTEVDLSELARQAFKKLHESDPGRNVVFHGDSGLKVRGDSQLLEIALDNLMSNAWKYSSRVAQAEITFGRVEKDGVNQFYLRDNGVGFDMKYADKLFVAFQRLHAGSEFEGTGVGLATVARIVHRHGGAIWAESEVEKGATFFFELPGD
jgi:signal transduction histidine kinase